MRDEAASRRYAAALVELAIEAKAEDAILRDLTDFVALIEGEGAALGEALRCPVFDAGERRAAYHAVAELAGWHSLLERFVALLIERERVADLPSILKHVTAALDARAGRVRVAVTTAAELSAALHGELSAAFASALGKEVVLSTNVDGALIGGLVARVGSRVYDASLRSRLAEIRHRLIHAQPSAEA